MYEQTFLSIERMAMLKAHLGCYIGKNRVVWYDLSSKEWTGLYNLSYRQTLKVVGDMVSVGIPVRVRDTFGCTYTVSEASDLNLFFIRLTDRVRIRPYIARQMSPEEVEI